MLSDQLCGPHSAVITRLRDLARREGLLDRRHIVINAGEGTSGTESLDDYVKCCGLTSLKWTSHGTIMRQLNNKPSSEWRTLNFSRSFQNFDYVSDTPISSIAPHLLAHFPNARVLLSTRNATQWVESRIRFNSGVLPQPLSWWGGINSPRAKDPAAREFAALAYTAQNALVACLTPPERFLEVPLHRLCDTGLQRRVAALLGSPCAGCMMPRCPEERARLERCEAGARARGSTSPKHHHCDALVKKEQSRLAGQNRLAWTSARTHDENGRGGEGDGGEGGSEGGGGEGGGGEGGGEGGGDDGGGDGGGGEGGGLHDALLDAFTRCAQSPAVVSSADAIELLPLLLQLPRNGRHVRGDRCERWDAPLEHVDARAVLQLERAAG